MQSGGKKNKAAFLFVMVSTRPCLFEEGRKTNLLKPRKEVVTDNRDRSAAWGRIDQLLTFHCRDRQLRTPHSMQHGGTVTSLSWMTVISTTAACICTRGKRLFIKSHSYPMCRQESRRKLSWLSCAVFTLPENGIYSSVSCFHLLQMSYKKADNKMFSA